MTILTLGDSNSQDSQSTFASMSSRRSTRAVRRPKYYSDEAVDEVIASPDHSVSESEDDFSQDVKPRKRVKSERLSSSSTDNTDTPPSRSGRSGRASSSPTKSSIGPDGQYLLRRERNNVSVRKSRARVREATEAAVKCIDELTREKDQLAKDQEILDGEITLLKKLIYHTFSPNPSTTGPIQASSNMQGDHSYSTSQEGEDESQKIDLSRLKFFEDMVNKT